MISPALPEREHERLAELESYRILDSAPEAAYDDLVRIAAGICGTSMSSVSLIDEDRQWFKARLGLAASETPRELAFCAHAINRPHELLVVEDARRDVRFADNPLVTGDPHLRFYAGAPLVTPSGHALGTICVLDDTPRELDGSQLDAMRALSRQVVSLLELRKAYAALRLHVEEREWYEIQLKQYQRDLEEENLSLTRQRGTDVLTGLANRRALNETLAWRVERAREGEPLHFAIIDIDHFKMINDLHGHLVGDETLAAVAATLRNEAAGSATVARAGGEEFVMLLPGMSAEAALRRCENVREAVELMAIGVPVTVSIGIAAFLGGDDSANDLYLRADRALYAAKHGGRNRTVSADG